MQGVVKWCVKRPTVLNFGESVAKFLYFAVSSASTTKEKQPG